MVRESQECCEVVGLVAIGKDVKGPRRLCNILSGSEDYHLLAILMIITVQVLSKTKVLSRKAYIKS